MLTRLWATTCIPNENTLGPPLSLGFGSTKRITTVSLSLSLFYTAQPTPGSGNKEELGPLDLIPLVVQYLLQGSVHHVLKLLGHTTR